MSDGRQHWSVMSDQIMGVEVNSAARVNVGPNEYDGRASKGSVSRTFWAEEKLVEWQIYWLFTKI